MTDLNNRQDAAFQVTRGDNGILQVVDKDKVDVSKLSKSEAELFKAVTDTENHATLALRPSSDSIMFDQYAGRGLNILDRADLTQLSRGGSTLPGEAIAHAAVEAYAGVGEGRGTYQAAHGFANQFFGDVAVRNLVALPAGSATATSGQAIYNFRRLGTSVYVRKIFITPQPAATVPTNLVVSTSDQKKK